MRRTPRWLAVYGKALTAIDDPRKIYLPISPFVAVVISGFATLGAARLLGPPLGCTLGVILLVLHAVAIRSGWRARAREPIRWLRRGTTEYILSGFATKDEYQRRSPSYELDGLQTLDECRTQAREWLKTQNPPAVVEMIEARGGIGKVVGLVHSGD